MSRANISTYSQSLLQDQTDQLGNIDSHLCDLKTRIENMGGYLKILNNPTRFHMNMLTNTQEYLEDTVDVLLKSVKNLLKRTKMENCRPDSIKFDIENIIFEKNALFSMIETHDSQIKIEIKPWALQKLDDTLKPNVKQLIQDIETLSGKVPDSLADSQVEITNLKVEISALYANVRKLETGITILQREIDSMPKLVEHIIDAQRMFQSMEKELNRLKNCRKVLLPTQNELKEWLENVGKRSELLQQSAISFLDLISETLSAGSEFYTILEDILIVLSEILEKINNDLMGGINTASRLDHCLTRQEMESFEKMYYGYFSQISKYTPTIFYYLTPPPDASRPPQALQQSAVQLSAQSQLFRQAQAPGKEELSQRSQGQDAGAENGGGINYKR